MKYDVYEQELYERSLLMVFLTACHCIAPDIHIHVEHTISNGYYCTVKEGKEIAVSNIYDQMQKIIKQKLVIQKLQMEKKQAIAYFNKHQLHEKAALLQKSSNAAITVYELLGYRDTFYGDVMLQIEKLPAFTLREYVQGYWLSFHHTFIPQPKLYAAFQQAKGDGSILQVSSVTELNTVIQNDKFSELVILSEMIQEQMFTRLGKHLIQNPKVRCILLAGPSSSGKSTCSHRLRMHVKLYGKQAITISMDDFYKNRIDTPKKADGTYDFDGIEAIDMPLFQQCMQSLLRKEHVTLPYYNFKTGEREWRMQPTQIDDTTIVIIEGIHALHPMTVEQLPKDSVYKVYINALTPMKIDEHTYIKTSDYRLLRRIARDYQTRAWNAVETFRLWNNVREKEDKCIYPYQEEADMILNTAMVYEFSILKTMVEPLLHQVQEEHIGYEKAQYLLELLSHVQEADMLAVPRYSIFAEFMGNSIFDVT